jgi:surfeit locus 1 family protein
MLPEGLNVFGQSFYERRGGKSFMNESVNPSSGRNRKKRSAVIVALTIFFFATFSALGIWQIERLGWKLDLIARVDARVNAMPVNVPVEADWPLVNAARNEYQHVQISGHFLNDKEALVYASTERGPGYWVLTPLVGTDGVTVFVNRGFVPLDRKEATTRQAGEVAGAVTVTGLLRLNEPKGTLLRSNEPSEDRWYSRDVLAMGAARGLQHVGPFFIDADGTPNPGGLPVGGLTIIHFRNSHLSYALTWFAMALMAIAGGVILLRAERRRA